MTIQSSKPLLQSFCKKLL